MPAVTSYTKAGADNVFATKTSAVERSAIPVNAADFGTTKNLSTLNSAMDAAEARGRGSVVYVDGLWDVGNGLSMAGRSCLLRGRNGSAGTTSNPTGSVIWASTQTGPVIDFTGWIPPNGTFMKKVKVLSDLMVRGSGVSDPTKVRSGVKFTTLNSATVSDISIENTGGPCLQLALNAGNPVYLSDFERIILNRPINAEENDVPFFHAHECNGNRFRSFGLMTPQGHSPNIGVSGAVVIEDASPYSGHDILFDGWWVEHLHIPSGGTIFNFKMNTSVVRDTQFFDIFKTEGATGTSYFRFRSPVVNTGGNILFGVIPGKGTNVLDPDMGVDMQQSRNRVTGTKGYRGTNVVLSDGVVGTDVDLGGAVSTATDAAVVDNSGNGTNVVRDGYLGFRDEGLYHTTVETTSRGPGPKFFDPVTPANGGVSLGTGGVRWQAALNAMSGSADAYYFRKLDGTPGVVYVGPSTGWPSLRSGTVTPEGTISAVPGSVYFNGSGGAGTSLYVKVSGAGATGWVGAVVGISNTATLDFPSIAASGSQELTITVTGAVVGDTVSVGPPSTIEAGLVWHGFVSVANTVKLRLSNLTTSPIDPAAGVWKATIIR